VLAVIVRTAPIYPPSRKPANIPHAETLPHGILLKVVVCVRTATIGGSPTLFSTPIFMVLLIPGLRDTQESLSVSSYEQFDAEVRGR
jgi:hypothetical protein